MPGRQLTVRYGAHPSQVADLWLPAGAGPHPLVVLVHGGFWRARWGRDLMDPLAADLTGRHYAACNVEYRRMGQPGGGWPGTADDVASAVDALAAEDNLDRRQVTAIGHSAGGHLALWLASRVAPAIPITAAVALAGVVDLRLAASLGLGDSAVAEFLGASPDFAASSPAERLPLGVPQLLVHGRDDDTVPIALSQAYAAAARAAGDDVEVAAFAGTGHFDIIDPTHPSWAAVVAFIDRTSPSTARRSGGGRRS